MGEMINEVTGEDYIGCPDRGWPRFRLLLFHRVSNRFLSVDWQSIHQYGLWFGHRSVIDNGKLEEAKEK